MPTRFLAHTLLLLSAITGVYLFVSSASLTPYTLQLVAVLVLAYAATHWLKKPTTARTPRQTISLDITLLTTMILLLVIATGALTSPFFFTLYFLLFAVALFFEIEATLILTGTLILFFLLLPSTDLTDLSHLSELFALLAITPLAIFTGHQYEKVLSEKRASAVLSATVSVEETDTLLFLSLNLKRTLLSSLDSLSLLIPQTLPSNIGKLKTLRGNLELLYQDLRNLYRSADELQQLIDRQGDEPK
ncbi:MAG: hypothetical protein ABII80_03220 [bacterium]